jgi:hypothetical protein
MRTFDCLQRPALVLAASLCAAAVQAQATPAQPGPAWRNATAGGPLRAGVYGRIEWGRDAAPPPVIYPQPVIASGALVPPSAKPVYLYVPPGQARKWDRHCGKYAACDQPVLFVRVDDSPSRLGKWKERADELRAERGTGWAALFAWRGED